MSAPDPATHARRAVGRIVTVAAVMVLGVGVLVGLGFREMRDQQQQLHALIEAEEAEDRVEEAEACVTSWEVRADIRRSDEEHGQAGGEALIDTVQPDDPAVVERYRVNLAERMSGASDVIEDPECDLDAARALLADPPNQEE